MKPVRCAIYTRKSSEEGLDQTFNSLDAQREACAAYILSQASEGWTALPDIYDDGGLSGGTLERPALQRLLSEVAAGRVDIIVVYKVDRLTRSLLDFSRLVEALDKAGTSFVSVTQSFNTTTSMGRLTLNMLLSFAQFEREVTAERIRDKIAASKARGMWMGGTPPLGYAPDGRSLRIIEAHAAIVRDIFDRYLRRGNVRAVAEELAADGICSPVKTTITGRQFGGLPFSRGQLYGILKCPTYVGEVHHRDQIYPGLHNAIIGRDIWDATDWLTICRATAAVPGRIAPVCLPARSSMQPAHLWSHPMPARGRSATAITSHATCSTAAAQQACGYPRPRSKSQCATGLLRCSMTDWHWPQPLACGYHPRIWACSSDGALRSMRAVGQWFRTSCSRSVSMMAGSTFCVRPLPSQTRSRSSAKMTRPRQSPSSRQSG